MGQARNWTQQEYSYLKENWGHVSLNTICKKLNRSKNAIKIKVARCGLGPYLENGEYITFNELVKAVTGSETAFSYKPISWIEQRGFPVKYKKVENNNFRIVYIDDFWEWAEKNRSFLDLSNMQENILGLEPDWVKEQRKRDNLNNTKYSTSPWTIVEDERLIHLLKKHKYTYDELSKMLHRTCGAIQRRVCDLKIKERPIKADNHIKWTDKDFSTLANGIKKGLGYEDLSEAIGRSSKAIRGIVFNKYKTERLDVVRSYIKNGVWGDGAPDPTVNQEKRKSETKTLLSELAGLIALRRNELGWDEYWQKDMCMNWDDIKGCTACENNCDECSSFIRIKPQYCVRCGKTFFEWKENKICCSCRVQRKKQAARKYAICSKKEQVS